MKEKFFKKKVWKKFLTSIVFGVLIPIFLTAWTIDGNPRHLFAILILVVLIIFFWPLIHDLFSKEKKEKKENKKGKCRISYKKLEDIPDNGRKKLAMIAAKWWKEQISPFSYKEIEATGDSFAIGLALLAQTNKPDVTPEQMNLFEIGLVESICKSPDPRVSLNTDYSPYGILGELAKKLKIPGGFFPQKQQMIIDYENNEVTYRYVCGGSWNYLYPNNKTKN